MRKNKIAISGVYKIISKVKPQRFYIGSSVDLMSRWRSHLYDLRKNKHHAPKLQNHYNKYREDDLYFEILEVCLPRFTLEVEQSYLDKLKPYFNSSHKAMATWGESRDGDWGKKISEGKKKSGYKVSQETKDKISKTLKAREHAPHHNHGDAISKGLTGLKRTEESKKRQSETRKSKDIVPWNKGKTKKTDERVAAYSKKIEGRVPWSKGLTKEDHPSLRELGEKLIGNKNQLGTNGPQSKNNVGN